LLRKKLRLSGGSGHKSASRIYFWSFAYGKTPDRIQAWSLREVQTPEAKPQRGFATAPLQSLARIPTPQGVDIITLINNFATDFELISFRATLINLTLISVALCICSFHYANTTLK
jgi:hypothetical protein